MHPFKKNSIDFERSFRRLIENIQMENDIEEALTHPLCRKTLDDENRFEIVSALSFSFNHKRNETYNITIYNNYGKTWDSEKKQISKLRIEMTNDQNIFEVYVKEFDDASFSEWKKKFHFDSDFQNFGKKFHELLDLCATKKTQFRVSWKKNLIVFSQHLEFKTIIIMKLDFQLADDEEYINDQALHQYISLIHNTNQQIEKLKRLKEHVQKKNPQLARQLDRSSSKN